MILFYSEECQHCNILIDTIKKHDTKKNIKLISLNNLKNNPLLNKISYVPALMFLPSKEIIYGKSVFDYLLLPNRGFLFNNTNTRVEKNISNSSIISPVPINNEVKENEPSAFSLGSIVSDRFSDINDNDNNSMLYNNDKVYKWSSVDHIDNSIDIKNVSDNLSDKKKLPSLDEISRERDMLLQ